MSNGNNSTDDGCYHILGMSGKQLPENAIHIAYGVDGKFIRALCTSIASVVKNTDSIVIAHVFSNAFEAMFSPLQQLSSQLNVIILLHPVDVKKFDGWATEGWSSAIYQRLVMAPVLSIFSSRFIYLDADVLCTGDISPLFSLDLHGNIVAAVEDPDKSGHSFDKSGYSCAHYFNSGVLLIDTAAWNKNAITDSLYNLLAEKSYEFRSYDQDALNIVLDGRVEIMAPAYNYPADTNQHIIVEDYKRDNPIKHPVLKHFMGGNKPWVEGVEGDGSDVEQYLHYEQFTPFKGKARQCPTTRREAKVCARYMIKNKKYGAGLYWFFNYIVMKFSNK